MRTLTPAQFFTIALLIGCCLFQASCSAPKTARSTDDFDIVQATSFWQPYLMYVLASPHSRLYVEIDAVEGCAPDEITLTKFRDFLSANCNKPDGIEIIRNDTIPRQVAQGVSRKALARKFLDGPPNNASKSSLAFLYVLFYDGKLCDQSAVGGTSEVSANTTPRPRERNKNPHVDFLPYPAAIFMNTRYGPKLARPDMPLHEAGHILGLAGRATEASGYHCVDSTCLMNWTIRVHISRLVLFRDPIKQHKLCARCSAQLAESSKHSPPTDLRFVGPVLVRSEAGYHVLSLPSRMKLIVGDLTEEDCREFATDVRNETLQPEEDGNALRWYAFAKEETPNDSVKAHEIIQRAKADPYDVVRTAAEKLEESVKAN
jgi:hypothetical protein